MQSNQSEQGKKAKQTAARENADALFFGEVERVDTPAVGCVGPRVQKGQDGRRRCSILGLLVYYGCVGRYLSGRVEVFGDVFIYLRQVKL